MEAPTKSTRRKFVDGDMNGLYVARPISFHCTGFRVESMYDTVATKMRFEFSYERTFLARRK